MSFSGHPLRGPVWYVESYMPNDPIAPEQHRQQAEAVREKAEDSRQDAERRRGYTEEHRSAAESARNESERFRQLAEEAREVRDQYRDEIEAVRQERERLREAGETARVPGRKREPQPTLLVTRRWMRCTLPPQRCTRRSKA